MKNITELTNYELYKNIFNPIFGYEVSYPDEWSTKDILNGDFMPSPFRKDLFEDIVKEIENLELEFRNGGYEKTNKIYKEKSKILAKYEIYEEFYKPFFNIEIEENYIEVELDYEKIYRCRYNKSDEWKDNKYMYLKFYDNGDIIKSHIISNEFRNSFFDKSTTTYNTKTCRPLSYNETIKMKKYFEDLNINIQKELDYQI